MPDQLEQIIVQPSHNVTLPKCDVAGSVAEFADQPFNADLETIVAERTLRLAATINQLEREAAERRSIENRLAVQGRFYQTILDKIVEGVFVTSKFDIITYLNESLRSVVSDEGSRKVSGKHVMMDFNASDVIGALVPYYQLAKTRLETTAFVCVPVNCGETGCRYYSGCLIPMVEDNSFNGMICTISDVTQEKIYRDTQQGIQTRLIQANKTNYLGFLVSGIDHEVNNPNNSIMLGSELLSLYWQEICSFLDILEEELELEPESWSSYHELKANVPSVISGIKDSVHRIEKVMTALREVAGKKALQQTHVVDLNNAVSVSVAILHHHIRKATNSFIVELGEGLPHVPGNAPQIIQVLINLLMNALQSLPEMDRTVSISTSYDVQHDYVMLVIRDQGSGIADDILAKVFDPFFTTRLEQGGSGLGLPISRHIINEHGGTLSLDTVNGAGTSATIVLPLFSTTLKQQEIA